MNTQTEKVVNKMIEVVEVFTKENCMPCKMTKKWLANNDINFIEVSVDNDESALAWLIENNYRTMPVVFKNGELVAMGFQPNKLKEVFING